MLKTVIFGMEGAIIDDIPRHTGTAIQNLQKGQYCAVPYVLDLINNLYEQGMKLILTSSFPVFIMEAVMDFLQIRNYFAGYVSDTQVLRPKPAPDIFLEAAKQGNAAPLECIVIEASCYGVTAAEAAGITSIGYSNPISGEERLTQAAILVEGFDEIDYNFINQVYLHDHMLPATILTTERLILRELAQEDIDRLCILSRKPGVREYITGISDDVVLEKVKHEAYIKNIYHFYGYGLWGIFTLGEQLLIGRAGIEYRRIHQRDIYELGYFIDPDYQGMGYAAECVRAILTYAFDRLEIPVVTAIISKDNLPSQRLAEKVGMSCSGQLTYHGQLCYTYELCRQTFHS
ncbi:GNAT family N-acetyltransferase [Anaerotaenia torta]|uniref:GNAT family N-acetyltransferase n=1 Tax=Anaerotaenia torta TaxID=433293 RepID=UPI003D1C77F3